MAQNTDQPTRSAFLQLSLLIFLMLLIPIALSNDPKGAICAIFVFVVLFFFPGYLLLTIVGRLPGGFRTLLSPIFGIVCITTVYDIFARASIATYFPYFVVALSAAGMILAALQAQQAPTASRWTPNGYESVMVGSALVLAIVPLFWRSGRLSDGEFVFYGPAGRDSLFHVTLLQRLVHHVPPDNFMVSGLRPSVYHYFDDLTMAVVLHTQNALHLGVVDLFDLYYRCYPILVYFLLGALAYRAGRQLLGTARGGVLSVLLLLGAGGLGWFFGALQTATHASHFAMLRAALFSDWTSWDGVDSILPLIHRPAHCHGLLICLAAITLLFRPDRSRRDWLLAGLLLGLMSGFNFTLAATFGVATVLACLVFLLQRRRREARDLAWFALFIFIASLPVCAAMLFSGFHNPTSGLPFRGPNLVFPVAVWGQFLGRIMPAALISWASLIVFPIVAYGIKLSGLRAMARFEIGGERHRSVAMVFAIAFALSFVIGTFFSYGAMGGIAIIFLQPTLWILGLFSLHPIDAWLERNRGTWRPVALWGMLGLTWVQALCAYNFSNQVTFDQDTAQVLQDIHLAAAPDDVIAYLPSDLAARPIWGHAEGSTNFAIMAMTGLDGYFSSESYTTLSAVSGLEGPSPTAVLVQAKRLYEQRRDDITSFVKGDLKDDGSARLARDHVRWIVVWGDSMQDISSPATPWRKTREIAVYKLAE